MFSFEVNYLGFIACLQDNGVIGEKQKEILDKMKGHVLHPIQFEEFTLGFIIQIIYLSTNLNTKLKTKTMRLL